MANRRMLSKDVTHASPFVDCSLPARYLYFELSIEADDDGICQITDRALRGWQVSENEVEELVNSGLIINLGDRIIAIKDWSINNYIEPSKYHPTVHLNKRALLEKDNEKRYFLKPNLENDSPVYNPCTDSTPSVYNATTEVSIDKYNIVKDSTVQDKSSESSLAQFNQDKNKSPYNPPTGDGGADEDIYDLIESEHLIPELKQTVKDWYDYKKSSKQPIAIKALLENVKHNAKEYNAMAVIKCINASMASGYKGIIWDSIQKFYTPNMFDTFSKLGYSEEWEFPDSKFNEYVSRLKITDSIEIAAQRADLKSKAKSSEDAIKLLNDAIKENRYV